MYEWYVCSCAVWSCWVSVCFRQWNGPSIPAPFSDTGTADPKTQHGCRVESFGSSCSCCVRRSYFWGHSDHGCQQWLVRCCERCATVDCFWEELDRLWFDVLRIWNLLKCQSFKYFSKIFMYVLFVKGEIVKMMNQTYAKMMHMQF